MDELISRQAAIDALEEQLDYLQTLNKDENPTAESKWYGVNWARNTIAELPSAQPEQRWIPCGKCIHADGKHRWCKVLDRSINEDYFCYWAEPFRKEGEA